MKHDANGLGRMTISAVERETGLPKDTLRVWERRYGFPQPVRDEAGERLYTLEDVNRLRLIRRLIDQGWRPGKLLAASEAELQRIVEAERGAGAPVTPDGGVPTDEVLAAIRRHDVPALRDLFQRSLLERGLQALVSDLVAPLNVVIGEAWIRGELGVPEEHFYTEQVQSFLRGTLASYTRPAAPPRVLLTTLPEEEHGLGLLMVEVMLASEGAQCCSLGPRMPLTDIRTSALTSAADIVALSFSAAYPLRQALAGVRTLRDSLPDTVDIWVGGAGAHERLAGIPGVSVIGAIRTVPDALAEWRAARLPAASVAALN